MAVPVDKTVERFEDVEANVAIVCNWTLFVATDVHVYFGLARDEAIQNVDYTVTLNAPGGYASFTITPKTSLLAKINGLIALNPGEENYVEVRRELDVTTSAQPSSVREASYASREFDRITLKLQQLSERAKRAFVIPFNVVDDYDTELPEWSPGTALMWHATLKKLVNTSINLLLNPTQQAVDAAVAAAASALSALNAQVAAAASAVSAAASAGTAASLIARVVPSGGTNGQLLAKTGPGDSDMAWQTYSAAPTGQVADFYRTTVPTGWVATGGTIGNASSGATTRANADCAALFAELWTFNVLDVPIYTSAGAPSTRGANAAADFAANKRIFVPDARGIFRRGLDSSRGVDSGRRVGSEQVEMIGPHPHNLTMNAVVDHQHTVTASGTSKRGANGDNTGTNWFGSSGDTSQGGVGTRVSAPAGGHTPTGTAANNTGTENRPRNVACLVCVKL